MHRLVTVRSESAIQKGEDSHEAFGICMTAFDRLLPPLPTLVAFEAAHRLRSFTRAAEELFMSQASVSRRIRELEDDLGVALFERQRHNVEPTDAAHELAHSVRLALSELSSTADRLRRQDDPNTSLTVLSSLSLTSAMVAPVLAELQAEEPGLQIRLLSECGPIEESTQDFDVGIQYGPSRSNRFEVHHVADESVVAVCSPAFAASLERPVRVEGLLGLPLLHVDYDDPTWAEWPGVLAATLGRPVEVDRTTVFSSYHVCLDAAERGDGVALGWERSIGPRLAAGSLVALSEVDLVHTSSIHAYVPRRAASHRLTQNLLDRLMVRRAQQEWVSR